MAVKKTIITTLACLGLGYGSYASAYDKAAPAACTGENVTVPCETQGWHVGAQYIYVQPTGDQLYTDLKSQSKWASGVRVETGYHFGNGNDVTLNWTYFSKNSKRSNAAMDSFFNPIDPEDPRYSDVVSYTPVEKVKSTFNVINLEFGQMAYWGEKMSTRLHAGVQYADIKRTFNSLNRTSYTIVPFQENVDQTVQSGFEQKFRGIGPRVGVDAFYQFGDTNLSLVGKAAVAVLAADSRITKQQLHSVTNAQSPDFAFKEEISIIGQNTRTRILTPAFEAKLGLEYNLPLAAGDLTFEGGYQWASYPQTLQTPNPVTDFSTGVTGNMNNFGYHGFYVGARWSGDLA
jgi:Legionella pneumophila major outer membrane protein precursor